MDWSVKRLTSELKGHDKLLFAEKTNTGMVQVWRNADKWDAAYLIDDAPIESSTPRQFILALTHDFTLTGRPVDWGIEPVMQKILEMDSWQKDSVLSDIRRERERAKENRDRARKNEMKARAMDMRKDFARATNDINTSTLDKVDLRRKKDAYSK